MKKRTRKGLKKLKYSPAALAFILPEKFLLIGNRWMKKVRKTKEGGRRWSRGLIQDVLQEISEQGIDGVKVSTDELEKTMWSLLAGEIKDKKEKSKEKLADFIYKFGEENVRQRIGQASDLRIAGKWPGLSDPSTKLVYGQYHKNPFLAASFNKRPISYLVIRHTGTDRTRGQVFVDEKRQQIEEYHAINFHCLQDGWSEDGFKNRADIDYHYLIDSTGNILAGRPDQYFAWFPPSPLVVKEVDDWDSGRESITVGVLGDLRRAKIAQKQSQSLITLCKTLIDLYKIEKSRKKILFGQVLNQCCKNFPQREFYQELGI